MDTGLKILSAEIQNFKNIKSKVIDIDGKSLVILGGNAESKSSFLQALLSPLDSKWIPQKPIKEGEEKASIKIKIGGEINGEKKEYNCDLYFSQANQSGRLVVTNELGETLKSPKGLLKTILGDISFDIFDFLRKKPKEQVDILKNIAGVNFFPLDKKRQEIYDNRTFVNKKADELDAILKNHGFTADQIEKYKEPVDSEPIKKELGEVSKKLEDYLKVNQGVIDRGKRANEILKRIEEISVKIKELNEENAKISEEHLAVLSEKQKGEDWLKVNQKPSNDSIQQRLSEAEEHNRQHQKIEDYKTKNKELNKLKENSAQMSEDIKGVDLEKQNMIRDSKLPVDGLSFNEDTPLYNNMPLEELQINKGKLIQIGAEIAIAVNPNLRVIHIQDGSLLDKNTLQAILKFVEEKGYQLLIEMVRFDGGELEVKFTEEIFK